MSIFYVKTARNANQFSIFRGFLSERPLYAGALSVVGSRESKAEAGGWYWGLGSGGLRYWLLLTDYGLVT